MMNPKYNDKVTGKGQGKVMDAVAPGNMIDVQEDRLMRDRMDMNRIGNESMDSKHRAYHGKMVADMTTPMHRGQMQGLNE